MSEIDFSAVRARLRVNEPTPLLTYLLIINKAYHTSYIDYMGGAKALYEFLAPLTFQEDKYPQIVDVTPPPILQSYTFYELAKIVAESESLANVKYAYKAIVHTVLANMEKFYVLSRD